MSLVLAVNNNPQCEQFVKNTLDDSPNICLLSPQYLSLRFSLFAWKFLTFLEFLAAIDFFNLSSSDQVFELAHGLEQYVPGLLCVVLHFGQVFIIQVFIPKPMTESSILSGGTKHVCSRRYTRLDRPPFEWVKWLPQLDHLEEDTSLNPDRAYGDIDGVTRCENLS